MFTHFRKIAFLLPLLILILIVALPTTRRYAALQLGLAQNTTYGGISTVWPQSQPAQLLSQDHWYKLWQATHEDENFNGADTYILEHPEQIALLAERARYLLYKCRLPQREGDLGFVPSPFNPQSDPLDVEYVNKRKEITKVLLVRIRELCLLGQEQEPQNSYFDMLLSIVSYAQYKDEQGWRYLQNALRKPHFDPHYDDLRQLIIQNEERILQRPLLWKEKMLCYGQVQERESSAIRNWGRWLEWQAILRIRAMKPREAMRVQSALSALGKKMIREARNSRVGMWGVVLMSQSYYAPLQAHTSLVLVPSQGSPHTTFEERYNWVQDYAKQHHLPQLQQMGIDLLGGRRYLINADDTALPLELFGVSKALRTTMFLGWTFCVFCLFFLASGTIFWCVSFRSRRVSELPSRRIVNITSAIVTFIILSIIGGIYTVALSGDRWDSNIWGAAIPSWGGNEDWQTRGIILLVPWLVAVCIALLMVLLTPFRRTCERIKSANWRQRLKVLSGGVGLALFPIIMIYASASWPFAYGDVLLFLPDALYYLLLHGVRGISEINFGDSWRVSYGIDYWEYATMYALIGIVYLALLMKYLRFIYPPHKKGHLVYLMCHALKNFVICCVIIYGISMFVTMMSRRVADREMGMFLAQGEMAYFGNSADLTEPIDPHQFLTPRR